MVCQRLALPDSECTGASFLMAEGMSHLVAFVYPNHPQQEQTAEVAETEPMSGEIVASMNEQQEITIKDLQKSMQMGVEQVSKLPEHLGPMLQGMRDLKGALPHPDRIQDEKTRQHFQAAHDELRETRQTCEQSGFASDPGRHMPRHDHLSWDTDPKALQNLSLTIIADDQV